MTGLNVFFFTKTWLASACIQSSFLLLHAAIDFKFHLEVYLYFYFFFLQEGVGAVF